MRDTPLVRRRPTTRPHRRPTPVQPTDGLDASSAPAPLGNQALGALAQADPAAAERAVPSALPHGNQAIAASIAAGQGPAQPGNSGTAEALQPPQAAPGGPTASTVTPGAADADQTPPAGPEPAIASAPGGPQTTPTEQPAAGDPWATAQDPGVDEAMAAMAPAEGEVAGAPAEGEPTLAAGPAPAEDGAAAAPGAGGQGEEQAAGPAGPPGPLDTSFQFAPGPRPATQAERDAAEQRRADGSARVRDLLTEGAARVAGLSTEGAAQTARIDAAGAGVRARIQADAAAQRAAIEQGIAAQIARAEAAAEAAAATITAAFDAAVTTVTTAQSTARQAVEQGASDARATVETNRDATLGRVDELYTNAETAYRQAGTDAAAAARRVAGDVAGRYQPVGDGYDDDYADKRRRKWAEACQKVGDEYAKGLADKGNEIAGTARANIETDRASVRGAADQALAAIDAQRAQALIDIDTKATAELATLQTRRDGALARNTELKASVLASLEQARTTGAAAVTQAETSQLASLDGRVAQARATVQQATQAGQDALTQGLSAVRDALAELPAPAPEQLDPALDEARGQLDRGVTAAADQLRTLADGMVADLAAAGASTATILADLAQGVLSDATASADAALAGLQSAADAAASEAASTAAAAEAGLTGLSDAAGQAFTAQLDGLSAAFTQMETALDDGLKANADALRDGLMAPTLDGEISGKCREEGRNAAKSVQPWWKSVLKWVAIIAVVIVVAVVLGPLIIGALAPLVAAGAAALGASAAVASAIGTVVAGAAVGALGGYLSNGVGNLFDGKGFNDGAIKATLTGALGGAIGAGASALVTRFAGPLAETFAVKWATDVAADTLTNILTGEFSAESLVSSILMGGVTNGATRIPGLSRIETRMSALGESGANRLVPGSVSSYHAGMTDLTGQPSKPAQQRLDEEAAARTRQPTGDDPQQTTRQPGASEDKAPQGETTPAGPDGHAPTTPDGRTPTAPDGGSPDAPQPKTRPATAKPTGKTQARELGFPDAPEGYTWVRHPKGGDPYLRRLPGRVDDGLPPLKYDPTRRSFVNRDTGQTFKSPSDVNTVTAGGKGNKAPKSTPDDAFTTHGLDVNDPTTLAEGRAMMDQIRRNNPGLDDAKVRSRALEWLRSGKDVPKMSKATPETELYKVVPKGGQPSEHSPYWLTRAEIDALKANPSALPDRLGLPPGSRADAYDVFKITPKQGKDPTVFTSEVAPVTSGKDHLSGGGEQTLVPNRGDWNPAMATGESIVVRTRPTRAPDPNAAPTGRRTPIADSESPENKVALTRENESADALARAGYDVEQNPTVAGDKNPDYRINGQVFDNYAPTTGNPRSIWTTLQGKVQSGQTNRVVLNLDGSPVDVTALRRQLADWPIPGLHEVLIVQGGVVTALD